MDELGLAQSNKIPDALRDLLAEYPHQASGRLGRSTAI
jgi:hypothetical protein